MGSNCDPFDYSLCVCDLGELLNCSNFSFLICRNVNKNTYVKCFVETE